MLKYYTCVKVEGASQQPVGQPGGLREGSGSPWLAGLFWTCAEELAEPEQPGRSQILVPIKEILLQRQKKNIHTKKRKNIYS